jgi:hypothetical protein
MTRSVKGLTEDRRLLQITVAMPQQAFAKTSEAADRMSPR